MFLFNIEIQHYRDLLDLNRNNDRDYYDTKASSSQSIPIAPHTLALTFNFVKNVRNDDNTRHDVKITD